MEASAAARLTVKIGRRACLDYNGFMKIQSEVDLSGGGGGGRVFWAFGFMMVAGKYWVLGCPGAISCHLVVFTHRQASTQGDPHSLLIAKIHKCYIILSSLASLLSHSSVAAARITCIRPPLPMTHGVLPTLDHPA